jgi:hypothetical protein
MVVPRSVLVAGLNELTAALVAYEGIPVSDVPGGSPKPDTVFYA